MLVENMPSLTLYRKDGSGSISAHMLLRELGLNFEDVPMVEGPNRQYEGANGTGLSRADFLKINPAGYVPVLVVDGTIITENAAVLFYICSLAPDRKLLGREPLEQAKVVEWLSWLSTTLNEYGFAGYWRPSRMLGFDAGKEAEDAVKMQGMNTILKALSQLEERLLGKYAMGDHLTVVDFVLHTFWRWASMAGIYMDQYPRFRAVACAVEQLSCVRATLAAENIALQFP